MTLSIARQALAAAFCLCLVGCAGFYRPLEALVDHDSPLVSIPATVGAFATGAVGVPIAVVALPFTVTASARGPGGPNLLPLAPVFATAQVGAIVLGGLPWLCVQPFAAERGGSNRESGQ